MCVLCPNTVRVTSCTSELARSHWTNASKRKPWVDELLYICVYIREWKYIFGMASVPTVPSVVDPSWPGLVLATRHRHNSNEYSGFRNSYAHARCKVSLYIIVPPTQNGFSWIKHVVFMSEIMAIISETWPSVWPAWLKPGVVESSTSKLLPTTTTISRASNCSLRLTLRSFGVWVTTWFHCSWHYHYLRSSLSWSWGAIRLCNRFD